MRFISILKLAISISIFFTTSKIWAHGDEQREKPKETKSEAISRATPNEPKILSQVDTAKIMAQGKLPDDVAVVRCTLSSFSSGRGLLVGLYDSLGKQILEAHSGTDGFVGFEGLSKDLQYEVRIGGGRYKGVAIVTSGELSTLNGERQ